MKKGLPRFLQPNNRLFIIFLILFAGATFFFRGDHITLALVEIGITMALLIYSLIASKIHRKKLLKYIEGVTYSVDTATKDTLMNFPMPMVIFSLIDNNIVWANEVFNDISGGKAHVYMTRMTDIVPDFYGKWLTEGKNVCPEIIELGTRRYQVFGNIARTSAETGEHDFLGTTYWLDITDYANIRDEYYSSRPIVSIIMIDNYDDVLKNLGETARASIRSSIEDQVNEWIAGTGALLRRYDRESYLLIFEERYLQKFIDNKFIILDKIKNIVSPSGIYATVSIGIGRDGANFAENFQFASLAIEMALSRGGDQAVIKNRFNFEFYGGRSTEVEKHTKVKSRVMANSLSSLISSSSSVYVMGHKHPDLDCIGAAIGICCIARKLGKKYRIIIDSNNPAQALIDRMSSIQEYKDVFINPTEAMLSANSKTLLVIVDTNRPEQVISENLLMSCTCVAVIDHHRRAAQYIQNAVMNFHEPYASSACELVTELLQYITEPNDILRSEAEAVLSGIVLDTKNFTLRTGGRTFDAAAFLRRTGADTTEVKRFLQNDLPSTIERYNIIRHAKIYRDGIAIAASETDEDRVIAAQAADELLNISGISASFVLFPINGVINISARSIGDVNVQLILEKLGGGGNKSTAGAQIKGKNLQDTGNALLRAIDEYLGNDNN